VGLVSVPALGSVRREERLRETTLALIDELVGDDRRAAQLADGVDCRAPGFDRTLD